MRSGTVRKSVARTRVPASPSAMVARALGATAAHLRPGHGDVRTTGSRLQHSRVFSSNASSGDDGEHRALNPRLYYVAFDSPYAYASYGKNWSTYYQVAGTTDRFALSGRHVRCLHAGTDGGASGTGGQTKFCRPGCTWMLRQAADKALQPQHAVPARPAYSLVEGADFGNQFGASAGLRPRRDGTRRRVQPVPDRRSKVAAGRLRGLDGDDRALALSTSWSGEHWNASLVWSRQDNHATTTRTSTSMAGAWNSTRREFHPRWWLVPRQLVQGR